MGLPQRLLPGWLRRHRLATGFAAGALATVAALGAVGYLVLADQRRSARVLAAALSHALGRGVQVERVTGLGPSRLILEGVRLPAEQGWPVTVAVESVEASGPLLAAARGEIAPVRLVVTRPTVTPPAAGAGGTGLEGLRQGLGSLLGAPAIVDLVLTGGVFDPGGAGSPRVPFDVTVRKGRDGAHAELVLHPDGDPPLTVRVGVRPDGARVRLTVEGSGPLGPLARWLPDALAAAVRGAPLAFHAELALEPGERLAGQGALRLGDRAALETELVLADGVLRLHGARGVTDLPLVAAAAGLGAAPPRGVLELADGEVAWSPQEGAPRGQARLRVPEAVLPPELVGADVLLSGLQARLDVEPARPGAAVGGEIRVDRARIAGVDVAALTTALRVVAAGGAVVQAELTGLSARIPGGAVRGRVAYDRGRADAQVEAEALGADALVRRLLPGWLGPADHLRTGPVRITVTGLALPDLAAGRVDTDVRAVALRRPDGQAELGALRVQGALRSGGLGVTVTAEGIRSTLPAFEGGLSRLEGVLDFTRAGLAAALRSASLVGRDGEGRELVSADLAAGGRAGGGVRLVARAPALERLAGLWPSLDRTMRGHARLELEAPDLRFAAVTGQLALRIPEAELLRGRVSLRDLVAEVPVRRGGVPAAAAAGGGPLRIGELVAYGVVVHDLAGRARVLDDRVALEDLRYAVYSGEGRGAGEVGLAADGPFAHLALAGEGVRIEEFIAAYGIRGGTMTGILRYDLDVRYRGGRLGADGSLAVPGGGTVTIELLDRVLPYAQADPTGVARRALENLRAFDYKSAEVRVRTAREDVRISVSLRGRERFGVFPPRVREINVLDMPLGFLARQFPSR